MKRKLSRKEKLIKFVLQTIIGTAAVIGILIVIGSIGNIEVMEDISQADIYHNLKLCCVGFAITLLSCLIGKATNVFED